MGDQRRGSDDQGVPPGDTAAFWFHAGGTGAGMRDVAEATFPNEPEARRLRQKLAVHSTPAHGSWLTMAEVS